MFFSSFFFSVLTKTESGMEWDDMGWYGVVWDDIELYVRMYV